MTMQLPVGESLRTLVVDGRTRNYLVHVPQNFDAHKPLPIVLAFHGATSNARLMRNFCGLSEKAEEAGFLVVYPSGTGHSEKVLAWNGGACCGYAKSHNIDDVAYVRALLDDLATVVDIDPRRIYATGMSNGAMMVYRLAAECANVFAAIAAVAGPMGIDDPQPSRPVPVLHIHGTDDQFAPYHGGVGKRSAYGVPFRSVADTVAAWVRINGCDRTPTIVEDPTTVDDGTRILRHTYKGKTEVILIAIDGGGHTWPGQPPFPETLGKSTRNLNANDVIWEFFQQHSLSEPEA